MEKASVRQGFTPWDLNSVPNLHPLDALRTPLFYFSYSAEVLGTLPLSPEVRIALG